MTENEAKEEGKKRRNGEGTEKKSKGGILRKADQTTIFPQLVYFQTIDFSPLAESTVISRVCAMTRTMHFSHECHPYTAVSGDSTRCYCDSDLCNSATWAAPPTCTAMAALAAVVVLVQRLYFRFHDSLV